MENFRRNTKFGSRGNDRRFDGRNSERPTMHKAVCSECGKECEVPFKPTNDKPVFCDDCFRNKKSVGQNRSSRRDSGRFNSNDKRMYKVICDNCGRECEVPFKPTNDKPVYCSECFGKKEYGKGSDQTSKQLEMINAKLDKILKIVTPVAPIEPNIVEPVKKKISKKTKVSKPKKTVKSKAKKPVSSKKKK